MKQQPYFYGRQIERYLIQFSNIFSGFQVKIGQGDREQMVSVPIIYGSQDKVVQSIAAGNTQNKLPRLPILSSYMSKIELAKDYYRGVGQEDRASYLPSGGMFPDDIKVIRRYMPIPYKIGADVYAYCSNQVQQLQLLEQIMVLFDPTMVIQTSDARWDWTKLTSVEMLSIDLMENYPLGGEDRVLITKMSFEFPVYITPPAKNSSEFVESIYVRMGNLDAAFEGRYDDFFDGNMSVVVGAGSVDVGACEPTPPEE